MYAVYSVSMVVNLLQRQLKIPIFQAVVNYTKYIKGTARFYTIGSGGWGVLDTLYGMGGVNYTIY